MPVFVVRRSANKYVIYKDDTIVKPLNHRYSLLIAKIIKLTQTVVIKEEIMIVTVWE